MECNRCHADGEFAQYKEAGVLFTLCPPCAEFYGWVAQQPTAAPAVPSLAYCAEILEEKVAEGQPLHDRLIVNEGNAQQGMPLQFGACRLCGVRHVNNFCPRQITQREPEDDPILEEEVLEKPRGGD